MLFGKYQFHCRFETEAVLPPYKGSTFRGVFGRALKQVVCALKNQSCPECLLRDNCVYSLVFETHLAVKAPDRFRQASPPHPFVIEPPATEQTVFPTSSDFAFDLLLFGNINKYLPYFIYAFEQTGRIGIGKKTDGTRGLYKLRSVKQFGEVVYSEETSRLQCAAPPQALSISASWSASAGKNNPRKIRVFLNTPLRLKFQNRLKADLPFHVLVRAMLRRVSSLFAVYGDAEPDLDYSGLVKRAEIVTTPESALSWCDWKRYSLRQDQQMFMGGMSGSVAYDGVAAEYFPLLDICSQVHLGKQTAFGLGKISWEILE